MRISVRRPASTEADLSDWALPATSPTTVDLLLDTPVFAAAAPLTPFEASQLLRDLATATESRLGLVGALTTLADAPGGADATTCRLLVSALAAGASLPEALAHHPASFPPHVVALVDAGVRNGRFPQALRTAADVVESDGRAASELRRAVFAPALATVVVGTVITAASVLVGPVLDAASAPAEVPLISRILIQSATFLPLLFLPLVVAAALFRASLRLPATAATARARRDQALIRVPGYLPVLKARAASQLGTALAWLLEVGTPSSVALEVAAPAAGNIEIVQAAQRAAARAVDSSLAEALESEDLLRGELARAARLGELSGSLPASLLEAAQLSHNEADRTLAAFVARIGPASALAASLICLVWLCALLTPTLLAAAGTR